MSLTPQILRPLVLSYLSENPSGTVQAVVRGVVHLATQKRIAGAESITGAQEYPRGDLFDRVQMIMWQMLPQGILVWGLGGNLSNNDQYPHYRLTEHGKSVTADAGKSPQPYDPDGFIKEFCRVVPSADPILLDYLTEAVRAFNSACYKSAAVMLGAASEKAILLLHSAFDQKIADPAEKRKFEKESEGISISKRFNALKSRLDLMVAAKKFRTRHEISDTILHTLPAASELIRRCRNDAGHPDIPTATDPDTVFLNLRVFTEHVRRAYGLIDFFDKEVAEW